VRAALEMKNELASLNRKRTARGDIALRQGIGVHSGMAIAGNVGTEQRLEYTVIGDAVNTASRLESSTKDLKREIIISETVYAELAGLKEASEFAAAGVLQLKGKTDGTRIYAA